jgi:hypothetical protein
MDLADSDDRSFITLQRACWVDSVYVSSEKHVFVNFLALE